ncbi:MAG TPA: hemerythrin family protein [Bryobacteraceae bacterium]|jgi:hemerythrin-like metal-binding protein
MEVVESIRWTDDDFVFVPQLDAEHQKLFQDAEGIRLALSRGMDAGQVGLHMWRLTRSFSAHIAGEERLMRSSRYPAFQWHERQHHAGRNKLARLTEASHRKDERIAGEALEDFARWMRDHVNLADRMFAAHLRNDRRERMAS